MTLRGENATKHWSSLNMCSELSHESTGAGAPDTRVHQVRRDIRTVRTYEFNKLLELRTKDLNSNTDSLRSG